MTTEEKARAYDSIIEKANKMHSENCEACKACIEELVPELAESEDEKVRKRLITDFGTIGKKEWGGLEVKDILAWLERQGEHANFLSKIQVGDKVTRNEDGVLVNLTQLKRVAKPSEKQGEKKASYTTIVETGDGGINALVTRELPIDSEQKSADKVEPKFKVGDWVIFNEHHNSVYQVEKIQDLRYYLRHYLGGTLSVHFDNELVRLWILQDAKSGDVLATKSGGIFIYKELLYDKPFAYCGVDKFGVFKDCNCGNGLDWTPYLSNVTPATKEQRTELFLKMKEAGYEWDVNTKELKKIENQEYDGEDYGIDGLYHAQRILEKTLGSVEGYQSDDGILEHKCAISAVKKLYEQNPAWSKEDGMILLLIVNSLKFIRDTLSHDDKYTVDVGSFEGQIEWLKSIQNRVQPQPKQERSEEDKKILTSILRDVMHGEPLDKLQYDWLKSLRPQNRWKPSEDDIIILEKLIKGELEPKVFQATLHGILEQLKKLKEG